MVRHHPAIRQKNIRTKLNRYHLGVYLHHNALQPTANACAGFVMVAKYFNKITNLKRLFRLGCFHIR